MMTKNVKIVCWVVGIPVALLFVVMALSPVAKMIVNNHGQDLIGRDMSVKRVFINPFFGTVNIRDFHCKEANGLVDFVSFESLEVRLNWLSLMGKHVNLRKIHLNDFSGEVLSGADEFNFTDIVDRFASKDTTVQDTTPSKWTVTLRDIQLRNGRLLYHDAVRDNKWLVDNVNLNIPGLYFGRRQSNAGLQFDLPTGGTVSITAGYVMASRRYAVTFRLSDVNTDVALPLVRDYLNVKGLGALVNGNLHIDGSLDNIRDMVVSGVLSMSGLKITDEDDEPVAGLEDIRLVIRRGDVAKNYFILDTLSIRGVTGHFERYEKYTTWSRLMKEPVEPDSVQVEEKPASEDSPGLTWATRQLLVTARKICFTDKSLSKKFSYAIDTLSLTGTNVASQGKNSLQLSGRLSDSAQISATYSGGLDVARGQHQLSAKLTGLKLPLFSPYTEQLFACPINEGELAMQIEGNITNGKLVCDNRITIEQPEIGRKARRSKAPYKNVPVKMGLEMLKSAQGEVLLDVPVKGDVTSPKFKFGKVFGRALAKVFFGPLMGVRDDKQQISPDEREEMMLILGADTADLAVSEVLETDSLSH